jgi:signal transduction histidine kinase/PAS domain-containing protein
MEDAEWQAEPDGSDSDGSAGPSELGPLQRAFHDLQVRQLEVEAELERFRWTHGRLEDANTRLADLYDFAPIVYLTLGPDCRILEANLTAASFFGRERGALIGAFLTSLAVPGDRQATRAHVDACMRGHVRVDSELSFTLRGRPPVTAQVASMPMLDAAGEPIGCKTVLTDISALKWAREKLLFINRGSTLLGSSFDVVTSLTQIAKLAVPTIADICILDLVDATGTLVRAETAFADEVKARTLAVLRGAAPAVHDGSALAQVLRTREPLLFASLPAPGGSGGRPIEHDPLITASAGTSLMYIPIVGRGNALGVLTFIAGASGRQYSSADVTTMGEVATHAAMAMETSRLYSEAQRAIAARQDVLSFVSHDLKNPLMGIMLTTETILRGAPGDERRRSGVQLQRIQHAAQQMRRMIDDLLDMTALEAGRLAVQIGEHDAAQLLQVTGDQFAPLAAARELALVVTPPDTKLVVACDRQRLAQVLSHLVDNALKFTPPGGRISISARPSGDEAIFAVADTGPGIPPALRPMIFERFMQASGHATSGRGLGLYIAKGLVAAQRGSIWVDSEPGQGATFSFTLPLASAAGVGRFGSTMQAGAAFRGDPAVERR